MNYCNIISKLRIQFHYSLHDIATYLEIGDTTYNYYEKGERLIGLENINKLANLYNVSLDYILGLTSNPKVNKNQNNINYQYLQFSIRFLRKKERTTQLDIANQFGCSHWTIWHYEKNVKNITIPYLIFISNKYHISIDYICGKTWTKEII